MKSNRQKKTEGKDFGKICRIFGIAIILLICFLMSNNKKKISLKTVISGLLLQFFLAVFILKVPLGQQIIEVVAMGIENDFTLFKFRRRLCFRVFKQFSRKNRYSFYPGASFLFAIKVMATIIFVMAIVNILYYFGIMQRVVVIFANYVQNYECIRC